MSAHGRRHTEGLQKIDRDREHAPAEAVALVKSLASAKFDESVEIHVRTGLNVRHADEQLRGTIALPNGLGKNVKVAVFAQGEKAREAEDGRRRCRRRPGSGQAHRGGRFDDFDVAIATPDLMSVVGRARPHPRPVGQDAKPEGRDRHDGRRQSRRGLQVGQGRVPHRSHRDRAHGDRQGLLRRAASCSRTTRPSSKSSSAPSPRRRRVVICARSR